MSKFELSLAKDYVPSWTVVDGIRELFQDELSDEAQEAFKIIYEEVAAI